MQVLRALMKRSGGPLGFCCGNAREVSVPAAAWPGRNERAVRAGSRMAQECADLVGGFGREDVLELAGLLFDFGFAVHREAVSEQTLGKAVAADDVGRALTAAGCQFDDHAAVAGRNSGWLQCIVTRIDEWLVVVRF